MPHIRHTLVLALIGLSASVFLPGTASAGTQQDRMRDCHKEAKEKALKGDERSSFMSQCLSGGKSADKEKSTDKTALAEKRKQCRADARDKSLKGDERKAFVADCVKA
ncbi:PsiF family protein [Methyloversatilis universalis]|uniref:PsiF family protein n=1 Tax=Methyloversatilis universalis TaxID=378211 RepID=UPI00037784C4|nr:PsiF family protein [Methyloversatilis universalis]